MLTPWVSLGTLGGSLEAFWAPFGHPLGLSWHPWAPHCLPIASLLDTWGSTWHPLVVLLKHLWLGLEGLGFMVYWVWVLKGFRLRVNFGCDGQEQQFVKVSFTFTNWKRKFALLRRLFVDLIRSASQKTFPFPTCLLYTSPSPRDRQKSRMPSSA